MSEHICEWCDRPAPHATICGTCVGTFRKALRNVGTLYADLATVRSKGSRFGGNATKGSVGREMPLVVDSRFTDRTGDGSQLDYDVKNTLVTWARMVIEGWPEYRPGPVCEGCNHATCVRARRTAHPGNSVVSIAAYLVRMAGSIAAEEWAAEILDEVLDLERRLRRMVDRPADRWYAGICGNVIEPDRAHDGSTCGCACHANLGTPCDVPGGCGLEYGSVLGGVTCERDLWADGHSSTVRCGDCGREWQVSERRTKLVDEAKDRHVTVATLARIVTTIGATGIPQATLEARIRQWVKRKKVTAHGQRVIDGRPRPVYRVGDVLELLDAETTAKGA